MSYENRLLIAFVLSFLVMLATLYLIPTRNINNEIETNYIQTNYNVTSQSKTYFNEIEFKKNIGKSTNIDLYYGDLLKLNIDTYSGEISDLCINGKWNRMNRFISLMLNSSNYKSGILNFGPIDIIYTESNKPIYNIKYYTNDELILISSIKYKNNDLEFFKRYKVISNYQFLLEFSISNASKTPVKLDFSGKSLSIANKFDFFTVNEANSGNLINFKYHTKNIIKNALQAGFLKPRNKIEIIENPDWLTFSDNYLIVIFKPYMNNCLGKYILLNENKMYIEAIFGIEIEPIYLESGESKSFKFEYYSGPKKETILKNIDKNYKKLFKWPAAFNWFMKPIEWILEKILNILSIIIPNWGIVIIVFALLIKLLLLPLSIKSAISIKKASLLQPKIKKIQEKYKDDQKLLQEKIAELYKQEKVNPFGGCLLILPQIPVFFALYRVLSQSIELKGAKFLWIKDLTQPDTLFRLNIPFLPSNFNLLPIIMTIIQLIQMKLQQLKNPAMDQQSNINTYVLPIIFLFLFWNMPSGLVLYWTIQNLFSIVEQEIVNLDKAIKL